MPLLVSTNNPHGGTYVSPQDLPTKKSDFAVMLNESISNWQAKQIKLVWIQINNSQAEFLPIAYKAGFVNHHCDQGSVILVKRLVKNALVPDYANHTIGIGGLVIDDDNRVLTIRELAHVKTHPHNWKFPGGMLDPYEHIEDGVKREVLEETGIKTEFVSFLGFRHHHQGQFTTSNIYAICRLKPLNFDIVKQASEIADAKWIDIDQYLADEKIGQFNKAILSAALHGKGLVSTNLPGYMKTDSEYEVFI